MSLIDKNGHEEPHLNGDIMYGKNNTDRFISENKKSDESPSSIMNGDMSLREALDDAGITLVPVLDEDIVKLLSHALEQWDGETI